MKKYLAVVLAVMMMASVSLTAAAAPSPSSTSNSSTSSSSSHKSSHKSSGGGSSSAASTSSSSSSAASAQAAANAAVTATYKPAQAVITADGQSVSASVSVAASPAETEAAFVAVAQIFGVAVTDTFAYTAAGIDPAQAVTTVFAANSIPAGSALLIVDAFGNLTVAVPVLLPDGNVAVVLPAACQVAVVAVPAA